MEHINQKFNLLSALGIILVVGGHCGINFIHQFPVYSFHMPLFIFISGYFFHAYDFRTFLTKKVKHLLIPFLLWNAFYWGLLQWFTNNGWTHIYSYATIKDFFWQSMICAWPIAFNSPSWFVIILFWTQLLYWAIHKITGGNVCFIGISCLTAYLTSLYLTFHDYSAWMNGAGIGIERTLFFLLFYFAGGVYRSYIERPGNFSYKSCLGKILLCFLINWLLLNFVDRRITYNINLMQYPIQSYWMPIVTACTGICLYMQFAEIIVHKIKRHHVLDFMGRHTYAIMTHHLFFIWLINASLWIAAQHSKQLAQWFDEQQYMTSVYYFIDTPYPREDMMYMLAGLCGPLLCCWLYDRFFRKYWHGLCQRMGFGA